MVCLTSKGNGCVSRSMCKGAARGCPQQLWQPANTQLSDQRHSPRPRSWRLAHLESKDPKRKPPSSPPSARASIMTNTYAGPLPLRPVTALSSFSSTLHAVDS